MTSWGVVILVGALIVGLRGSVKVAPRYSTILFVIVLAIVYAAVKQHTY